MNTAKAATLMTAEQAQTVAKLWNGNWPTTELSFEPVMKPDGHYVVACIEETPDGARLRGYL